MQYYGGQPQKKETVVPTLAGVFNLLVALSWGIWGVMMFLTVFLFFVGIILFVVALFAIFGAIYCFQRENFTMALVFSLLCGNILSLILVAISKEEFDWPKYATGVVVGEQTRTCLGCGRIIPLSYSVCPHCGRPSTAAPAYVPQPTQQPPAAQPPPGTAPPPAAAPPPAQPQPDVKFCSNCGASLPAGAGHCPNCGTKV